MENSNLIPFSDKKIRKILDGEEWYFSIIDIIDILTDSPEPRKYWDKVKRKLKEEGVNETSPIWRQFKLKAHDGKSRLTDCANTEGVFRIIMSVPSPKAEPLRLWLAEQGKRTIDETENPELLTQRQIEYYKAKGYPEEWIKQRMISIETRKELTEEWQKRGIIENKDYSTLTAVISKGTFGLTPSEYKEHKGLTKPNQELRDHMTRFELIFTALGEEAAKAFAMKDDAKGYNENYEAAMKGGKGAGQALENFEKTTGLKVVSKDNFLPLLKQKKGEDLPESSEPKE